MKHSTEFKLKIRNARKTYGPVVALENTSLEMKEGEFLTLLGPSGSGKSTLLMAIAGLNDPDSGEVWIDGKLATYLPPFERDIGMVFQNYALFPHMTIFDNIAFPLRMRKVDAHAIKTRVERVLETVQLGHVAQRLPRELSGGQQQRIALARCFVYEPSIILMDEPLGALDKKLRDALQLEIKHLHEKLGITVLYVTHDQEEAMVMSDRICLMNNAAIEQIGTPEDLYFRPRTVFAADFLGESNLIDATVAGSDVEWITVAMNNGAMVRGTTHCQFGAGEKVRFMVRPECVRMLGEHEQADNVADAVVKEIILSGPVVKYYLELAGGTEMKMTQLTHGPLRGVEKGKRVRLGWSAERTVMLDTVRRSAS